MSGSDEGSTHGRRIPRDLGATPRVRSRSSPKNRLMHWKRIRSVADDPTVGRAVIMGSRSSGRLMVAGGARDCRSTRKTFRTSWYASLRL